MHLNSNFETLENQSYKVKIVCRVGSALIVQWKLRHPCYDHKTWLPNHEQEIKNI